MTVLKRLPLTFAALILCASATAALASPRTAVPASPGETHASPRTAVAASPWETRAKPPPGMVIDPEIHQWFEALVRADGVHCCGAADCRVAAPGEVRTGPKGFEVQVNGWWMPVPESLMVHRENGPIPATIVCKSHYESKEIEERLYCVIPYAGG